MVKASLQAERSQAVSFRDSICMVSIIKMAHTVGPTGCASLSANASGLHHYQSQHAQQVQHLVPERAC